MNAQLEIIMQGLQYPEGAFYSHQDNCIYFVECLGERISGYRDGKSWIVYQTASGSEPCGLSQDREGSFWACLYSAAKLVQFSRDGELLQVFDSWQGRRFKGPNDLSHTPDGGLFFSDSGNIQEDWITGQPAGSVYYLGANGDLECAATEIAYANGIANSTDGRRLYVSEHRRNRILLFDHEGGGVLTNRRVFAELDDTCLLEADRSFELGPDGICLDMQGWLWVAHYGGGKLIGFSQHGETKSVIRLPGGRLPTNLAFHPGEGAFYITEAERGMLLRIKR